MTKGNREGVNLVDRKETQELEKRLFILEEVENAINGLQREELQVSFSIVKSTKRDEHYPQGPDEEKDPISDVLITPESEDERNQARATELFQSLYDAVYRRLRDLEQDGYTVNRDQIQGITKDMLDNLASQEQVFERFLILCEEPEYFVRIWELSEKLLPFSKSFEKGDRLDHVKGFYIRDLPPLELAKNPIIEAFVMRQIGDSLDKAYRYFEFVMLSNSTKAQTQLIKIIKEEIDRSPDSEKGNRLLYRYITIINNVQNEELNGIHDQIDVGIRWMIKHTSIKVPEPKQPYPRRH